MTDSDDEFITIDPSDRELIEADVIDDTETSNSSDGIDGDSDSGVVSGVNAVNRQDIDADWAEYFPFDTVYADQVDGINAYIDLLADHGNLVMEGACGTGKTLVGLVSGIYAVRNRQNLTAHVSETVPDDKLATAVTAQNLADSDVDDESDEKQTTEGDGSESASNADDDAQPRFAAPDYSRVFAATPVKQQLKQFIAEMRNINKQLEQRRGDTEDVDVSLDAVDTLVLRGKADMLALSEVTHAPLDTDSVTEHIDDFRDRAVELIKFDSSVPLEWPDSVACPDWSRCDYDWSEPSEDAETARDAFRFDPNRAMAVLTQLQELAEEEGYLTVNGVQSPYPDRLPQHTDVIATEKIDEVPLHIIGVFDPFFIGFHADTELPVAFGDASHNVLDREALFRESIQHGLCPHLVMSELMKRATVLIGNYYHLFDEQTRLLTDNKGEVIDEETVCVIDEGHNIEPEVRDMLSDTCDLRTLQQAQNDIICLYAYRYGEYSDLPDSVQDTIPNDVYGEITDSIRIPNVDTVQQTGAYSDVTKQNLLDAVEVLSDIESWMLERATRHLDDDFYMDWRDIHWEPDDVGVALETPKGESIDELLTFVNETVFGDGGDTRQSRLGSHNDGALSIDELGDVVAVCEAVETVLNDIDYVQRDFVSESVGAFFRQWERGSRVQYFREIRLTGSRKQTPLDLDNEWTELWTPALELYNCLPTDRIREVFSEVGSVLTMSATLEPFNAFIDSTGIDESLSPRYVRDRTQRKALIRSDIVDAAIANMDVSQDVAFRDTVTKQYSLKFPESNRFSGIVTLPKYTARNRGDRNAYTDDMTSVRAKYAGVIESIALSDGCALIAMPSYSEAKWAQDMLVNRRVDEKVDTIVLDQSSSSRVTDDTLESFFNSDDGVLLTSTRGTVTEGVDYDGDKLDTCAVIGIALLPPTDRQKATEYAYDECIDSVSGWEATNEIPATRKARQAIGRVIRGEDEVGVRLLVDNRYEWSVNDYLSRDEQEEFVSVNVGSVGERLREFWKMSRVE